MKRHDRPLVPSERRRRPHTDAFADESTLIDESQLLDPIADDDGIDWKTDPFEMRPDTVNSETPDEIIAGSPRVEEPLQRVYRHALVWVSVQMCSLMMYWTVPMFWISFQLILMLASVI